jgi:transcriptional regulator with XRE-family HTH domain
MGREYIPETIGGRIRQLREKKEMTRTALARIMYVDRRTVSRWEDNAIYPRSQDIRRLSECFGVSCDYIIIGKVK